MADRTSAEAFGTIFELLSKKPNWDSKELALKIWQISRNYDFSPCQMECNKDLVKLELAKKAIHPDYPEEGKQILYRQYGSKEEFSF